MTNRWWLYHIILSLSLMNDIVIEMLYNGASQYTVMWKVTDTVR